MATVAPRPNAEIETQVLVPLYQFNAPLPAGVESHGAGLVGHLYAKSLNTMAMGKKTKFYINC